MPRTHLTPTEKEILRQSKETFDQVKKQDRIWFLLKTGVVISFLITTFVVLGFAIYIIFNHQNFPDNIVNLAMGGFIVDIISSSASVWKLSLNPKNNKELSPVQVTSSSTQNDIM